MDPLVGRQIAEIRRMNDEEMDREGWSSRPPVIVLDDGSTLFPASEDGDGPGELFGERNDTAFRVKLKS